MCLFFFFRCSNLRKHSQVHGGITELRKEYTGYLFLQTEKEENLTEVLVASLLRSTFKLVDLAFSENEERTCTGFVNVHYS